MLKWPFTVFQMKLARQEKTRQFSVVMHATSPRDFKGSEHFMTCCGERNRKGTRRKEVNIFSRKGPEHVANLKDCG